MYSFCVSDPLVETLSELKRRGYTDETLFLCSCYQGRMDKVKLMIEKGKQNCNKGLEWACCHGHMNVVKLMLENGANNLIPLSLPEFVAWIPDEELIPFYNLPHLSPVLKQDLEPRVEAYKQMTKDIIQEISKCNVILPDIVRHILVPYMRHTI